MSSTRTTTAKTAREKREEYAKRLAAQRRTGTLNTRTRTTRTARIPLACSTRPSSSQTKENHPTASNLIKRSQPATKRKATVPPKRPRVAVATSRSVSRQESQKLAKTVQDTLKQEYLQLKTKIQQLEDNAQSLVESLQETQCELTQTNANLKTKTSEHSQEQSKQIQLQGESDRFKLESQQRSETTNMLQVTLQDTKERLTLQLETEQAKFDALSYAQKTLKEQHSATSSRVADAKRTIAMQETKMSNNESSVREFTDKLELSIANTQQNESTIDDLASQIRIQEAQIKQLEVAARKDEITRRQLHDSILDLKGTVRVFIRVHESESDSQSELFDYPDPWRAQTLQINPNDEMEKLLQFEFDKVFSASTLNNSLFKELDSLIESSVEGDFVNIFTYGESVIESPLDKASQYHQLISHALVSVLKHATEMKNKGWCFRVAINCVSIVEEAFTDVLSHYDNNCSDTISRKTIRDVNYVSIDNVRQFDSIFAGVHDPDDLNDSTVILQVHIDGENQSTGETSAGLLNIVSLASPTSKNDSKSPQALSKVISAMANQDNAVPFRQYKLTSLLQESLCNGSKTLFLVNLTNSVTQVSSHLSTLRFAKEINSCNIARSSKPRHKGKKKR